MARNIAAGQFLKRVTNEHKAYVEKAEAERDDVQAELKQVKVDAQAELYQVKADAQAEIQQVKAEAAATAERAAKALEDKLILSEQNFEEVVRDVELLKQFFKDPPEPEFDFGGTGPQTPLQDSFAFAS